ncbi:MAG TPA: DUF1444 family protein [Polyangiaceae bacterium]
MRRLLESYERVSSVMPTPDAYGLDVELEDGGKQTVFLENMFVELRELSPDDKRDALEHALASFREAPPPPTTWPDVRPQLLLAIRAATYGQELADKIPDAEFERRPFVPFVDVVVVIDSPTSMAFVNRKSLQDWKVSADEVFAAAEGNLPAFASTAMQLYDQSHGPAWLVASQDTYEASRLLLPGWLASFRGKVEGNPIAIMPDRSTVIIGGDARPDMVTWLLEKAEREFGASPRRLSPALYGVDDEGRVVPYRRTADDELAKKVDLAHERLAMYEYGNQKEYFDAANEREGVDVFIASYQVFKSEDGALNVMSLWTETVHTVLPRTRTVALNVLDDTRKKSKRIVRVPFEALLDRLKRVEGAHPELWETSGKFPSSEELDAFAARYPQEP